MGWAATQATPLILADVRRDPRGQSDDDLPGLRSALAIPLVNQERVVGVLDLRSTQLHAFAEDDLRLLQPLAAQLAIAVANARLFAQLRQPPEGPTAGEG